MISASRFRRGFALLGLVALGACEREPYVYIDKPEPLRVGESDTLVATYAHRVVRFPFASSSEEIYTSADQPGAFTWTSSDTAVVRVDGRGTVSARRAGRANVVARAKRVAGGVFLQVTP